jgi:EAL domain-containing protein (putative c-di-GMP-specific phosphodiesterase class I)
MSGEDMRILQTVERLAQAQHLHVLGSLRKPTTPDQLRQVLKRSAAAVRPVGNTGTAFEASELHRAIESGELVNHYQPKVDIATGELIGVETLVRWQHPSAGLVYPDRFIAIAEQNDLIEPLTQAVLDEALRQTRRWLDEGLDISVAVNVSMDSLTDLGFADRLTEATLAADVPLERLVLEVTESLLMRDPVAPADILARLRLRHVGVSIDDFGTGHSSLAKLRDIPFNELKIDRGFVHGASRDSDLRSIVEASLAMAHHLNIHTVAEGVEDREDWDFLRAAGCDLAQGYFIGRPMPAEGLLGWIEEWTERRRDLAPAGGTAPTAVKVR